VREALRLAEEPELSAASTGPRTGQAGA
jgi:hypothetical protein